jgi:acyl-CoA synthetase (AMP-forming)/AMP-acid ligase II
MALSSRTFRSSFPDRDSAGFRSAVWKYGVPKAGEEVRPLHPTVVRALSTAHRRDPGVGITLLAETEEGPSEHRSWAEIDKDARKLAARLAQRGVRKGETVLMAFPTSFDFVVSLFALMYLGALPVPAYPPAMMERAETALERLNHIARAAEVTCCLTTSQLFPVLGDLALATSTLRELIAVDRLLASPAMAEAVAMPAVAPDDIAFLQYTSGSTGNPKGVAVTHRNVCANLHVTGQAAKISRQDRVISWLPLYHDMGLVGGMLWSLFFHVPLILMSPVAFLLQPVRWLRAISDHRCTLSLAPNFAYALCVKRVRPGDRAGLDLSSWRQSLNGAEPVNYRTVVDFERAYAPHGLRPTVMSPVYGLAEAVVGVTFPTTNEPVHYIVVDRTALATGDVVFSKGPGSVALVGCGQALPGHQVLVVDAEGKPAEDRVVGHIVVRGPSVMQGYFKMPAETARVLRDGWLWTGDLGFFHEDRLYVAGRAKDVLIVRGHNYYAEDVERIAERVDGIRPGGSVAFGVYDDDKASDLAVLICETRSTSPEEHQALVRRVTHAVSEHTGLKLDEVVLIPPSTIPKTSSGKRQRSLTRQRYLEGTLLRGDKTKKWKLALVFARSGAGLLTLLKRKITRRRSEPA